MEYQKASCRRHFYLYNVKPPSTCLFPRISVVTWESPQVPLGFSIVVTLAMADVLSNPPSLCIFYMIQFNPCSPLQEENPCYNHSLKSGDKVHCLVGVMSVNAICGMSAGLKDKLRAIRDKASSLGKCSPQT